MGRSQLQSSDVVHEAVGADFIGAGAPLVALSFLNVSYTAWASDIQQHCRDWVQANFRIQKMFEDVTVRDHGALSASSYIAGFPCKPWSRMNAQKNNMGFQHKQAKPLPATLQTIQTTKPRWCVLENVPGLLRWWPRLKRATRQYMPVARLDKVHVEF